ncbi:hypothetical protein KA078_01070 [Candidatus Woesebacteria bacterium]|nr:hypothetical protein [Candidatus Woesebacteria bacterium]
MLTCITLTAFTSKTHNQNTQNDLPSQTPSNSSSQKNEFPYPVSFFRLQKGTVAVVTENDQDSLIQNFTLTLTPHAAEEQGVQTIKIPLKNIDYVGNPKISHKKNYGCVTVGASGYSGYYIFSLSSGMQISQGEQYSECVEWLSDTKLLIVEEPYGKNFAIYSIFDVLSKTKTTVSQFSTD